MCEMGFHPADVPCDLICLKVCARIVRATSKVGAGVIGARGAARPAAEDGAGMGTEYLSRSMRSEFATGSQVLDCESFSHARISLSGRSADL